MFSSFHYSEFFTYVYDLLPAYGNLTYYKKLTFRNMEEIENFNWSFRVS